MNTTTTQPNISNRSRVATISEPHSRRLRHENRNFTHGEDVPSRRGSADVLPRGDSQSISPFQTSDGEGKLHHQLRIALIRLDGLIRHLPGSALEDAAQLYHETVKLYDQLSPRPADVARVSERLGELLERIRHEDSAVGFFRAARALFRESGDRAGEASVSVRLKKLRESGVFTLENARAHSDRGRIALACEEWATAIEAFRRSRAVLKEVRDADLEPEWIELDINEAKACIESGDSGEAERLLTERIEALAGKDSGDLAALEARILQLLGMLYEKTDRTDLAVRAFERCLTLAAGLTDAELESLERRLASCQARLENTQGSSSCQNCEPSFLAA